MMGKGIDWNVPNSQDEGPGWAGVASSDHSERGLHSEDVERETTKYFLFFD